LGRLLVVPTLPPVDDGRIKTLRSLIHEVIQLQDDTKKLLAEVD
jgi:hypothetical protein